MYAKEHEDKLLAPMPRLGWFKAAWKMDWLSATWAAVARKRSGGQLDKLVPDLRQKDIRMRPAMSKPKDEAAKRPPATDDSNVPDEKQETAQEHMAPPDCCSC